MNHRVTIHVWLGVLVLLHILGATSSASAQEGSLSKDMIGQIQATFQMDASTRAVYNAVTNNGVKKLALNRDILRRHNEFFSDKICHYSGTSISTEIYNQTFHLLLLARSPSLPYCTGFHARWLILP